MIYVCICMCVYIYIYIYSYTRFVFPQGMWGRLATLSVNGTPAKDPGPKGTSCSGRAQQGNDARDDYRHVTRPSTCTIFPRRTAAGALEDDPSSVGRLPGHVKTWLEQTRLRHKAIKHMMNSPRTMVTPIVIITIIIIITTIITIIIIYYY